MENKINELCAALGISAEELLDRKKGNARVSICRQAVTYYFRRQGLTVQKIGFLLNRIHGTVCYSIKKFGDFLEIKDEPAVETWNKIKDL